MRARAIARSQASAAALRGRVLCEDVRDAAGRIVAHKGAVLQGERLAAVLAAPWDELHCFEVEPGDLLQDPAGQRLALAAAGPGVEVTGVSAGQWTLAARHRGLLRVDIAALDAVNAIDGIAVFTLYDGQVVDAGEAVARAKATRLVIGEGPVAAAEARAREAGGLVRVLPFPPRRVAAVAKARLDERGQVRFEAALREKLGWFGSELVALRFAGDLPGLTAALEACREAAADLVLVAGASGMDPLDPVYLAVERLGGRIERHSIPAHPGTHLWLARLAGLPLLGVPSCGMFSQATMLDVVLPRLLAGEAVGARELAALGHGGLLTRESAFRFPRYRASRERGSVE
ncbi:MAG TPA: molybdopterin-binding protein [Thermodesulfobacteriota bacterium]|nr:molybdopterin-binding protein [Thermodesulfobacteriota bacterium]